MIYMVSGLICGEDDIPRSVTAAIRAGGIVEAISKFRISQEGDILEIQASVVDHEIDLKGETPC